MVTELSVWPFYADLSLHPLALDRDATEFESAYHLAVAAKLVYMHDEEELVDALGPHLPVVVPFREGRVFGCVAGDAHNTLIAFRGTRRAHHWRDNLRYGQVYGYAGRVHEGFAKALDQVWNRVLAGLYDVGLDSPTLWLTGHSMGGALAVLAAQRLHAEGFDPHLTCTFGAPRVLNPVAAAAYEPRVMRFVNPEDMVPTLPWNGLVDEYEHVGEELKFLPSGAVTRGSLPRRLDQRYDRIMNRHESRRPSGAFKDHRMEKYIENLRRNLT
jgi:triacylglycerol lipase